MNKEVYDYGHHDLTKYSREELYEEILSNQNFSIGVLSKVDWIIGAFISTLETDFHFGKQRMKKVLKGVADRFRVYSDFPGDALDFLKYLEKFDYRLTFKGHRFLLRDLNADKYYDDLAEDLKELAHKITLGKELTDDDERILGIVREVKDE